MIRLINIDALEEIKYSDTIRKIPKKSHPILMIALYAPEKKDSMQITEDRIANIATYEGCCFNVRSALKK